MNFEDEDYVRYYTRDTVSWRALGWEGQTVLALMLHGKFDRSGVFDCDGHPPESAVAIVTGLPPDVAREGLARILRSEAWVYRDGMLVWPKYIEAQTCRRSDRSRQAESRERRRLEALGLVVPECDGPSHGEVKRDGSSQVSPGVTLSLAYPSLAEPSVVATASPPAEPAPSQPIGVESGSNRANGGSGATASKRPSKRVPNGWTPKPEHEEIAFQRGVNYALELSKFRDHEFKSSHTDWDATFRNWLRNAIPHRPSPTTHIRRVPPAAAKRSQEELEAEAKRQRDRRHQARPAGSGGAR